VCRGPTYKGEVQLRRARDESIVAESAAGFGDDLGVPGLAQVVRRSRPSRLEDRPAVVRFYFDVDLLGLAKVRTALRPDMTYPPTAGRWAQAGTSAVGLVRRAEARASRTSAERQQRLWGRYRAML
jgi:hypothetical protein